MSKKWTTETAKAYVMKVLKGKQQPGLTYCSAIDYLLNYANIKVSLAQKDSDDNISNPIR